MAEVRINVVSYDDYHDHQFLYSSSETICCRICHEAEFESSKILESPCSCSGTVKFAHRDCVQRWCDEKGNTICEICLQNFEPGYIAPPPKKPTQPMLDTRVTIRSLEVPRTNEDEDTVGDEESLVEREFEECSSAADTTAAMCRSLASIFTILLLIRHFIGVLIGETGDYPFTLFTLLLIKACGILLPMYIIMRMIDVVHNSIKGQRQGSNNSALD
uniref:Zinc finger, RING-CH-type n=1 Tax=Tanacetum cinerariifolium TaxID=118510 RepID=A0A6L2M8Z7_TANCI|nr:zinc finger, RING-CH-type [Tanacetum cinerariifolium]